MPGFFHRKSAAKASPEPSAASSGPASSGASVVRDSAAGAAEHAERVASVISAESAEHVESAEAAARPDAAAGSRAVSLPAEADAGRADGTEDDGDVVLRVRDLRVTFRDDDNNPLPAVSGVGFELRRGRVTCLVGESGCGKSLTARACLGLTPPGCEVTGSVVLSDGGGEAERNGAGKNATGGKEPGKDGGIELLSLSERAWRTVRGARVAMIFQEPMTALNPVLRAGFQAAEPLLVHRGLSRREARKKVVELFAEVGIPSPEQRYDLYPHELSGGMRQRVMIAMALSCEPDVLLADEPTTALDATIQGQILSILDRQCRGRGMSVLLITHDLGVVGQVADTVGVMYAGHLVEWGTAEQVLEHPAHPYTRGLMACDPAVAGTADRLPAIRGVVPPLGSLPDGCPFHPRCPLATDTCRSVLPEADERDGHRVLCHHVEWPAPKPDGAGSAEGAERGRLRRLLGVPGRTLDTVTERVGRLAGGVGDRLRARFGRGTASGQAPGSDSSRESGARKNS